MNLPDQDDIRLRISREAARLFLADGVAKTSGDAIAAAVGLSTRTVWRHFRNKEACIGPVLAVSIRRFTRILNAWPEDRSLEDHLYAALPLDGEAPETIADGALAVRLVALCAREPDVRSTWLEVYHGFELRLREVIARRANRSTLDHEVRLCAATIAAAIRIIDQDISVAAVNGTRTFTPGDLVDLLSRTIRAAATLPICDPIATDIYNPSIRRLHGERSG